MQSKTSTVPMSWRFWHPHQKLWNTQLILIIKKLGFSNAFTRDIIKHVIRLDTFLLSIRLKLGHKNFNLSGYTTTKTVNYFDIGTHKEAKELQWVVKEVLSKLNNPYKVFAFEANPVSYNAVIDACDQSDAIHFYNLALVKKIPKSGQIKLYTGGNGLSDSIYRTELDSFTYVEAKKLSTLIKEANIELKDCINIIRMNIEGCEFDVIEDLIENDLIKYFDGFYGMWDDVSKIDRRRDKKFRNVLRRANVQPFPFNGRDMKHENRKTLIKKSLEKSIFGKSKKQRSNYISFDKPQHLL